MTVSLSSRSHATGCARSPRLYRLVDRQGEPHPVLDDLYECPDAAWAEAMQWWQETVGLVEGPMEIGMEVSTSTGDWRTLRHPGC